ncbi:hypothetical protein [Planktotalea sp.]|uniref:hypothetical protein n=1 Tax=Planktotalea sp. TaxID=2029877 RepID=UPI003D6BD18D
MNEQERDTAVKVYFDATSTIRHYDKERTSTHRVALAVLSGLLALASTDFVPDDVSGAVVSVAGVFISIIFYIVTAKYAGLIEREKSKARAARSYLAQLGDNAIADIDNSKTELTRTVPFKHTKLSALWSLYYAIFVIGFIALAFKLLPA